MNPLISALLCLSWRKTKEPVRLNRYALASSHYTAIVYFYEKIGSDMFDIKGFLRTFFSQNQKVELDGFVISNEFAIAGGITFDKVHSMNRRTRSHCFSSMTNTVSALYKDRCDYRIGCSKEQGLKESMALCDCAQFHLRTPQFALQVWEVVRLVTYAIVTISGQQMSKAVT